MSVSTGDPAPSFDLDSDGASGGARVKLEDFAGTWLILYFYPKDNTPGCTREAQAFTEAITAVASLGASVVGISKDSVKSHCGFRDKWQIAFPLLSDADLAVHKAYGAWGTKVMYGKAVEGTLRCTFLIGPDGRIVRVWKGVKVDGHVDKVLDVLREARGSQPARARSDKGVASKTKKPATP